MDWALRAHTCLLSVLLKVRGQASKGPRTTLPVGGSLLRAFLGGQIHTIGGVEGNNMVDLPRGRSVFLAMPSELWHD